MKYGAATVTMVMTVTATLVEGDGAKGRLASQCDYTWYSGDFDGLQCVGMTQAKGVASFPACALHCCQTTSCLSFQWKDIPSTKPTNGYAGGGCFWKPSYVDRTGCFGPGAQPVPTRNGQPNRFPDGWRGGNRLQYSCGTGFCSLGPSVEPGWGQNYTTPDCDGDCPLPPTPKDDSAAAGGTTGLVLMAICFPALGIYFGAGAYRNWKAGEQQFMPHRAFWTSLPGLIKTGFRFSIGRFCVTAQSVTGLGGTKGFSAYDDI